MSANTDPCLLSGDSVPLREVLQAREAPVGEDSLGRPLPILSLGDPACLDDLQPRLWEGPLSINISSQITPGKLTGVTPDRSPQATRAELCVGLRIGPDPWLTPRLSGRERLPLGARGHIFLLQRTTAK